MTGHICPECGTDNRPDTGQGCGCAERAAHGGAGPQQAGGPHDGTFAQPATGAGDRTRSQQAAGGPRHLTGQERAAEQRRIAEQHHAGRSAEMAAVEDFDPLRIRPYVTLGGEDAVASASGPPRVHLPGGQPGDAAATMPLFLDPGPAAGPPPDAVDRDVLPPPALLSSGPNPVRPRRHRPFTALIAGAAVVTVVGTAAFVGGLFKGDGSTEADLDQVLPSTVTSLPDESTEPSASRSTPPSPSASLSRPASRAPSASASASASVPASPSSSATAPRSASSSPSQPAAASSPSATAGSSAPAAVAPSAQPPGGPTLRRGDHGPEVTELQTRLQMVGAYNHTIDADYTARVEKAVHDIQSWWGIDGDPDGVYGPHTRSTLERYTPTAETP